MTEYESCIRCGRKVDIDSDEFTYSEAADEDGSGWICESCLTPEEVQEIYEDDTATDAALEAAGLTVDNIETMDEPEYETREQLAEIFYEHDSPRGEGRL